MSNSLHIQGSRTATYFFIRKYPDKLSGEICYILNTKYLMYFLHTKAVIAEYFLNIFYVVLMNQSGLFVWMKTEILWHVSG